MTCHTVFPATSYTVHTFLSWVCVNTILTIEHYSTHLILILKNAVKTVIYIVQLDLSQRGKEKVKRKGKSLSFGES